MESKKLGHGSRKMSPYGISLMKYTKVVLLSISVVGSVPKQEGHVSGIFLKVPPYHSAATPCWWDTGHLWSGTRPPCLWRKDDFSVTPKAEGLYANRGSKSHTTAVTYTVFRDPCTLTAGFCTAPVTCKLSLTTKALFVDPIKTY